MRSLKASVMNWLRAFAWARLGRPPFDDPAAAAQQAELSRASLAERVNQQALLAAILMPPAEPVTPLLQTVGFASTLPRFEHVLSPWFAYWARELDRPPLPRRELWRQAACLQAMFEAGVLRPGRRLRWLGQVDPEWLAYLSKLGLSVTGPSAPPGPADIVITRNWLDRAADERTLEKAAETISRVLERGGLALHLVEVACDRAPAGDLPQIEGLVGGLRQAGALVDAPDLNAGEHPLNGYLHLPLPDYESEAPGVPNLRWLDGDVAMTVLLLVTRAPP